MPHYNYVDDDGNVEVYSTMVEGTIFRGTPEEFVEYKVQKEREPPHFANSRPDVTFEEMAESHCENQYMLDKKTKERRTLPDSFCDGIDY